MLFFITFASERRKSVSHRVGSPGWSGKQGLQGGVPFFNSPILAICHLSEIPTGSLKRQLEITNCDFKEWTCSASLKKY